MGESWAVIGSTSPQLTRLILYVTGFCLQSPVQADTGRGNDPFLAVPVDTMQMYRMMVGLLFEAQVLMDDDIHC